MNLAWLTDLHFDFVEQERKEMFFRNVMRHKPDAIVITGDISRAKFLPADLVLMSENLPVPIYFVTGNHDYYGSGFEQETALIDFICQHHPNLHHLGKGEVVELTLEVGLVGHRGWYDGQSGNSILSDIQLNDFVYIKDLIGMGKAELFAKLEDLGRESADYFRDVLPKALARYKEVLVITHVPPFEEAARHGSKATEKDFLPFFCNFAAGEVMRDIAKQFPDRKITVLAGHTHSPAHYVEGNIECHVGGVIYGEPRVQLIFNIE